MTWLSWVSGAMLLVAAVLTVARMIVGPTVLNRALANDVLVSIIVCALGVETVVDHDDTTLPILITVSLLGFVSTVAVSRFVARDVDLSFAEREADPMPARPGDEEAGR